MAVARAFRFPEELVKSFKEGNVCLFVGSGVSCSSGLKGWDDLIASMRDVMLEEASAAEMADLREFFKNAGKLDIAEVFRDRVGENRYHDFLRREYRLKRVNLSPLHKALRRLPVNTIFTTNYDKLLERTFRNDMGDDPPVIHSPEQLAVIDSSERRIIKIHGDIDHPKSIILTRKDYEMFEDRYAAIQDYIRRAISFETMFFVGFGLEDPNFERFYANARKVFLGYDRRAFAVMTNVDRVKVTLWEKTRQLVITVVPNYLGVARHIEKLADRVMSRSENKR